MTYKFMNAIIKLMAVPFVPNIHTQVDVFMIVPVMSQML